ncbi:MAG: threonine--tRNA ligase [Roseiflexaceae bacterium]
MSVAHDQLYKIRHSAAHVMAQAVLQMFPDAGIAIGPPIDDGFYYDFDLPRALTPDDLAEIEGRMRTIIAGKHSFIYREVTADEARQLFAGQTYKLELIEGLAAGQNEYGESAKGSMVTISTYRQDTFEDLCRGPHVANTSEIPADAFKLMSVAGAYWRGDEKRPQLQRIYATAWSSKDELDHYLFQLEEAKRRDHRKLGRELGLFYFSEDVGPGLPLFTPKGEMLRYLMESYVRDTQTRYGYQHVWTGHLVKETLYHKSGHYDNYRDSMFPPMVDGDVTFRLKPMNCPSHMTLFKEMGRHSYRELPMRMAEFATLYRYEDSGAVSGLTRVRSLTQDDCHVFCMPSQIQEEFSLCLKLITEVLNTYQLTDYRVRLSLRGDEGKFVKDDDKWEMATTALKQALDANGVAYEAVEGEAAFYGPKADFLAKDALGREWQLSTIQVDFIQPARLGVEYVGEDSQMHTPVLIHRAVTGSTERFLGVIIEHFAGAFPLWLAPVQAVIIPISDEKHGAFAQEVQAKMTALGMRVEVNMGRDRMQAKIRDAQMQKIPYMLIVGDREAAAGAVAVRMRGGQDLGAINVDEFIARAQHEIATKA